MRLFDLFFLQSAILIFLSTDISKYFRESLGIRYNESRLYIITRHSLPEVPTEEEMEKTMIKQTPHIKPLTLKQRIAIEDGPWNSQYKQNKTIQNKTKKTKNKKKKKKKRGWGRGGVVGVGA